METVANFFGGNPFATPIGQKIERATDASLSDEDWGLNIEICDMINEAEDGPKDAVRAIKKRLHLNAGKNHNIVMHTLIVLETCVKNCGRRFHVLVCNKDFVNELVKLIGPKNDPPIELQEKVLTLIQTWSDAFQQLPELQGVTQVYHELKSKGIEFPMTNLDTMAPILTPQRTLAAPERSVSAQRNATESRPAPPPTAPEIIPGIFLPDDEPVLLNASQMGKLQSDLADVEGNMSVFSEMLAALIPGQEQADDLELLNELNNTCREMQRRIVELLDKVANDEITAHLLKVNDDLNNIFLRYDRYEKNRQAVTSAMPANPGEAPRVSTRPPQSPSFIDLGDDHLSASAAAATVPLITTNMQSMGIRGGDENDFDMFAQSRTATYDSTKQNPSFAYSDPDQLNASLGLVAQQRQQEPGDDEATLTPAMKEYLQRRSTGARTTNNPDNQGSSRRDDDSNLFSL